MDRHSSDPNAIHQHLRHVARYGARAAALLTYRRALIDELVPPEQGPEGSHRQSLGTRAIHAEELIRAGIRRIGGPRATALEIVLDLAGHGTPLEERREAAAQALGIASITFRRSPKYEHLILLDLSVQLCRMSISDSR